MSGGMFGCVRESGGVWVVTGGCLGVYMGGLSRGMSWGYLVDV